MYVHTHIKLNSLDVETLRSKVRSCFVLRPVVAAHHQQTRNPIEAPSHLVEVFFARFLVPRKLCNSPLLMPNPETTAAGNPQPLRLRLAEATLPSRKVGGS